jgi:broad specificity phosphatase PhoE
MSMEDVLAEKEAGRLLVFLIRHGKPQFPGGDSYIYGHTDYPLSDEGVSQAAEAGEVLRDIRMDRILSSDLSRARETARIVAGRQNGGGAAVEEYAELREVYMGEWDGLRTEEVKGRYPDIFRERGSDIERVAAPGGENFLEVRERALGFLEKIIDSSAGLRRVLISAHAGVLWGMIAGTFGIPLGNIFNFGLDYCALHIIEHGRGEDGLGRFRLVRFNWEPGLMDFLGDLG